MSKSIGIDLGTTNSAVALKRLNTEIVLNAEGDPLTPSVVAYRQKSGLLGKKGEFIVGKPALDWMAQDPSNTVVSIKRLMGRSFNDPEVTKLIEEKRFAYRIQALTRGSEHSVAVVLGGREYAPEQISARILEKLKTDTHNRLEEPVEYAVVTVPAYFNDKQKHATRSAAALAGFRVQRLLPEPTAAAISFGVDNLAQDESQTILVFDFGGGTFDLSVLTIAGGQFIEQGKGGDMWLGGDDIDSLITNYVYEQTKEEYELDDVPALVEQLPAAEKNRFLSELRQRVESAKIQLSDRDRVVIEVLGLLKDEDGELVDIEVELRRAEFERLITPFVDRTAALALQVLEDIHFDKTLIDKVVMVGGSSSIPLVIAKIRELFGADKVEVHPRPMLAIAEGAAILAHRLSATYECPACGHEVERDAQRCEACGFDLAANLAKSGVVDIVHTVSHDYYLELEDGGDYLLVEKNTPLPFHTQATFKLLHPEQYLAHFRFFNLVNEGRESIGDLWLSFSPDDLKKEKGDDKVQEVVLDFSIDENNLITVSASLKDHPQVVVSRTLSRGGVDEKLFLDLEQAIDRVNEESNEYFVTYDFLNRAIGIAADINRVVDPETGREDKALRNRIVHREKVALELVEKKESILGNIYYAENLIKGPGRFLPPEQRKRLERKLKSLRKANEGGITNKILMARDALFEEIHKHPLIGFLEDLENAISDLRRHDPAKAPQLENYHDEILQALSRQDTDTINRVMKEAGPKVRQVLENIDSRELRVWKGVRR